MKGIYSFEATVSTGGGNTPEAAMATARGFHHAAGELEALLRRMMRKQSIILPRRLIDIACKTSIGRRLLWLVSNGLYRGRHLLFATNQLDPHHVVGLSAGA